MRHRAEEVVGRREGRAGGERSAPRREERTAVRAKCRSVSLATVNSLVAKPTTCDRCVKSGMARLRERAAARCERVCRGVVKAHVAAC